MNLFDIIRARLIDGGGGGGADEEAIYQEILDTFYGSGSTPAPSNFRYVEIDTLSATQNGVYNAPQNTAYSSVNVSVSGGGGKDHTFDIPTISGSYTYDGTAQTPTISGFYSDFMTESGDFSGTTAGTYSIVFTLKDTTTCQWRDGTTAAKTVAWSIAKAALPKPTLSSATISLNSDNLTGTFTVTRVGDGVISATSADSTKVTASVSGDTVTVTLVDTTAVGSTVNITVTVAEGTNYLAYSATDVVCAVEITQIGAVLTVTGLGASDPTTVTFTTEGTFDWNFTEETINGNVFIKIPTMYRKVNTVTDGQITSFSISNAKVESNYQPYPCFLDTDGTTILPYVLIGKYCMSSSSVANSVNATPVTQTLTNGRTNAQALGTGYQLYDWQLQKLFVDLALMKSQKVNFNDGSGVPDYMGISHLAYYMFVDGVYRNYSNWYICYNPLNYTNYSSSIPTGYEVLSYTTVAGRNSLNVKKLGYDNSHPFANFVSGTYGDTSYSTYYCNLSATGNSDNPLGTRVGNTAATNGLWSNFNDNFWNGAVSLRLCYRPISST